GDGGELPGGDRRLGVSLFEREGFERFVLSLKRAEIVHQWGDASVGKVGGKIFVLFAPGREGGVTIAFKCSDMAFELLPEMKGVSPARYLARAKWVDVAEGSALDEAAVRDYVAEAHRLIAARLPKRIRAGLGLDTA